MTAEDRSSWALGVRRVVGALGGMVLGLVLLVAALVKSLDITAFAEQIAKEGSWPRRRTGSGRVLGLGGGDLARCSIGFWRCVGVGSYGRPRRW